MVVPSYTDYVCFDCRIQKVHQRLPLWRMNFKMKISKSQTHRQQSLHVQITQNRYVNWAFLWSSPDPKIYEITRRKVISRSEELWDDQKGDLQIRRVLRWPGGRSSPDQKIWDDQEGDHLQIGRAIRAISWSSPGQKIYKMTRREIISRSEDLWDDQVLRSLMSVLELTFTEGIVIESVKVNLN